MLPVLKDAVRRVLPKKWACVSNELDLQITENRGSELEGPLCLNVKKFRDSWIEFISLLTERSLEIFRWCLTYLLARRRFSPLHQMDYLESFVFHTFRTHPKQI